MTEHTEATEHGGRTTIYRTSGGRVDSPLAAETPSGIYETGAPDTGAGELAIGYLSDGAIYRLKWGEGRLVGRYDAAGNIFRTTAHGERELGSVNDEGTIYSAGLFAGGELGWVNDAGIVTQAGLILGEEEIGRVEGSQPREAAAALLLLFLPDERESEHRQGPRDG